MNGSRNKWAFGLGSVLLLLIVAALAAMKPANELELQVLKGRKADLVEDQGRGGHVATYRLKEDLQKVVSDLEEQLGPPTAKSIDMGHANWHLGETQVLAGRGKIPISQDETAEDNRRRLEAKMGSYEWSIAQGHDKWVTIQVRQEPSSFSRFWFRVQDIFHF